MNSKDRMTFWRELPDPKPIWEDWKRILALKGNDPDKAWSFWLIWRNKKDK